MGKLHISTKLHVSFPLLLNLAEQIQPSHEDVFVRICQSSAQLSVRAV